MNKYESVIIVAPTVNEKQQKEIENKYTKLIKENGKLKDFQNLGKKKLAYEIKKNKEGIYMQIYFESEASFIAELERQYRIDDNIMKFIVVRED
ncbi:MAG: 30S ribosomal protein S6 [Clostridia bacterium]|nr:30S ribosomal protein S6 [Clostridia bacterium]